MDNKLSIYKKNMKFYRVLKSITQAKFTDKQLLELKDGLIVLNEKGVEKEYKLQLIDLFSKEIIVGKSEARISALKPIVDFVEKSEDKNFMFKCVYIAVLMYSAKSKIINKIKSIEKGVYEEASSEYDLLSLQYDEDSIEVPYILRSASPIIISRYFKDNIELNNSDLKKELDSFEKKYMVDTVNQYILIIGESINQSITSNAGTSYEKRFIDVMKSWDIQCDTGIHDDRQSAIEYDAMFMCGEFKIGVSLKRTLRERYKQNHRAVNELEVDKMLVVTLGTDLNESKMDNILELQGQYILVASEIYNEKQYMIDCPRVFSSAKMKELLDVLSKKGY